MRARAKKKKKKTPRNIENRSVTFCKSLYTAARYRPHCLEFVRYFQRGFFFLPSSWRAGENIIAAAAAAGYNINGKSSGALLFRLYSCSTIVVSVSLYQFVYNNAGLSICVCRRTLSVTHWRIVDRYEYFR